MRRVRVTPVVLFAVISLSVAVVAGCNSTPGAVAQNSSGPTRGVTATQIKIGGLVELTSSSGGGYPGAAQGAEARFARVNRDGGIDGRKIDFIGIKDDASSATQDDTLAHQLVQEDGVFAIVPATSATLLPATTNYLNSAEVPFVGWGFVPGYCGTTWGFGYNGCLVGDKSLDASTAGVMVDATHMPKGSAVAIITNNTTFSETGAKEWQQEFASFGMNAYVVKSLIPISGVTDYSPYVNDIMTSNHGGPPSFVYLNPQFGDAIAMTAGLKAAGFKGGIGNAETYVPGNYLATNPNVASSLDGSYVLTQFLPQEAGGATITQVQNDLKAIGASPSISIGVAIGYWTADVMVAMLEAVGKNLTLANFNKVINQGHFSYTSPGFGTVSYPADHNAPTPCSGLVQVVGTAYKLVTNGMTCIPNIPAP